MMNPPSFSEAFKNLVDAILFSPATPTEYWLTLACGLIVGLLVLFQTQSYFGAGGINLPTAFTSLAVGLGVMIGGALAFKCYIFPMLPQDLLPNIYKLLTSFIDESVLCESAMENIILAIISLILLFIIGCPITAAVCRSSQFAAGWSWMFALIIGMAAFFLAHIAFVQGKQVLKSTSTLEQSETQHKKSLLDGEKY